MNIHVDDNNEVLLGVQTDEIDLRAGDTINLGSSDYNDLTNKPSIEGVELVGDVSLDDLGVAYAEDIPTDVSELTNDAGYITSPNVVFCTCDTAANVVGKVATIVSGSLTSLHAGDQAIVKFTNTNTASNPTLKIGNTDAKALKRYGTTAPGTTNATSWTAGTTFICVYDGTNWALVSWINTAYSEISEANITNGTSSSTGLVSGRRVKKAVETFAPVTSVNGQTGAVTIGSDVFYAEYNVTSFQDVKDAYDVGKTIITFDSGSGTTLYYPLCAYADTGGTEGFAFEKIDADCYYTRLILLDTDVWSTIDGYLPYNNLDGTPTNLSDFNNDSGFITKSAFAIEEVNVDWTATGSANSSATKSPYTVTHPNTDWEVLGIVGWDLSGSGIATIRVLKVAIDGNGDIYIYGHNDNSSNRTLTMTCRILYIHK